MERGFMDFGGSQGGQQRLAARNSQPLATQPLNDESDQSIANLMSQVEAIARVPCVHAAGCRHACEC